MAASDCRYILCWTLGPNHPFCRCSPETGHDEWPRGDISATHVVAKPFPLLGEKCKRGDCHPRQSRVRRGGTNTLGAVRSHSCPCLSLTILLKCLLPFAGNSKCLPTWILSPVTGTYSLCSHVETDIPVRASADTQVAREQWQAGR